MDVAISDCQIRPFDRMHFELPDQELAGFWTSREENKPARVTVDAVDGIDLRHAIPCSVEAALAGRDELRKQVIERGLTLFSR